MIVPTLVLSVLQSPAFRFSGGDGGALVRQVAATRKAQEQVGLDSPALRRLAYDKMAASFGLVDGETTLPARKRMWAHHKQYVDWKLPPQVGLSQGGLYTAIFRGTDYDGKPFQVLI